MGIRKIRGAWHVDLRWKDERHRRLSPVNSAEGARRYELVLRQHLEDHECLPSKKKPVVLQDDRFTAFAKEWFDTYAMTNLRPGTQRGYAGKLRTHLVPYFGNKRLRLITAPELERFKAAKLADGLHPKTVNASLSILRMCLRSAVEWNRLKEIPRFRWLKAPPPDFDYLNPSESRRLLLAATEQPWRLMIHLALRTGMRLSELLGLQWECVDFEQRLILVRRALTRGDRGAVSLTPPKNNRYRYIPIAADLWDALLERREAKGFIVRDPLGRPAAQISAARALHRACRAAGLRRIGWHALRHTFASQLTSAGAPLHGVQAFLGHATQQMTLRYAHFAPTSFRTTVEWLAKAELQAETAERVGTSVGTSSAQFRLGRSGPQEQLANSTQNPTTE